MDYRFILLLQLFLVIIVLPTKRCREKCMVRSSDDGDHTHNLTCLEIDFVSCGNVLRAPTKSHGKEKEVCNKSLYYNDRRSGKEYKCTELTKKPAWEKFPADIRETLNIKESPIKAFFSRLFIIVCVISYCSIWVIPFSYLSGVSSTVLLELSHKRSAFQVTYSPMKVCESYKGKRFHMENYLQGILAKMKDWKSSFLSEMGDAWSKNTYNVYSLKSSMERVASFSGFRNPSEISMLKLSKFGFYYTKEGELIKCTDCAAVVQASKIVSPPSDKKYHASSKCQFAQTGEDAIGTACMIGTQSSPNNNGDGEQNNGMAASGASNNRGSPDHMKDQEEPLESGYNSQNHDFEKNRNATIHQNTTIPKSEEDHHDGFIGRHKDVANLETATASPTQANSVLLDKGVFEPQAHKCNKEVPKDNASSTLFTDPYMLPGSDNASPSNIIQPHDLTADKLPSEISCDKVVSFLKKGTLLTVRVKVFCTKRPDANTDKDGDICGTGSAFLGCTDRSQIWLKTLEDNNELNSEQLKIWKSHSKIYYFAVVTHKHVVFNQEQALRTEVKLTLEQDSENSVCVQAIAVKESSVEGDYASYLICYTLERDLLGKLYNARKELTEQADKLPPKMKEVMTRYSLIVSHLPGRSNMISFGKSTIAKYVLKSYEGNRKMEYCSNKESLFKSTESDIRDVLLYHAPTYPGSSGSPVFTFRKTKEAGIFKLSMWIHNGIENTTNLGGSIMKSVDPDCLSDYDPVEIEVLEARLRSTELLVLGDPISEKAESKTVKKGVPPLYPEYFFWKERQASFVNFKSNCHHSDKELALGGFFYTGKGDCVRCFYCGLGLKAWRKEDDMYVEHERSRSSCGFLKVCLNWQGELKLKLDLLKKGPTVPAPKDGKMTQEFTISLLTEENRILHQQRLCKMCFRHDIRELFLPCGEIQTCEECAGILSTCPACNKKIDATVSVFMS